MKTHVSSLGVQEQGSLVLMALTNDQKIVAPLAAAAVAFALRLLREKRSDVAIQARPGSFIFASDSFVFTSDSHRTHIRFIHVRIGLAAASRWGRIRVRAASGQRRAGCADGG